MKKAILCSLVIGFIYAFSATTEAKAQDGCSSFLGRAKERLCQTQAGYDACVNFVRQGTMDVCILSGKSTAVIRRTTPQQAEADLIRRGCKKASGNVYQCGEQAMSFCIGYQNFFGQTAGFPTQYGKVVHPVDACRPLGGESSGAKPSTPSSFEAGNLYLYGVGQDGALWMIKKANGVWGSGQRIGGGNISGIDACSPNPGKTVVMARGVKNDLGAVIIDRASGKNAWLNYFSLIGSDPGTACQSGDRINLFVRAHNNSSLYTAYAEQGRWAQSYKTDQSKIGLAIEDVATKSQPQKSSFSIWDFLPGGPGEPFRSEIAMLGASGLGGQMTGSPDGVAFGGNDRAVFVRAGDNTIWLRATFAGKPWEQFGSLGGTITSDPTAISRKPGEILLFGRGEDNALWVRQFLNGNWGGWHKWGGTVAGNPDAASWGGNRVDVFYRGADGAIYHAWLDNADVSVQPKIESVPGFQPKGDVTAVGATW